MTKSEEFLPLPLHGLCTGRNKGAMDWAHENLAALANGSEIIVIDTNTLEILQVLTSHKASVSHLLWLPSGRQFTSENKISSRDLISADSTNQIIIWDVLKGQPLYNFIHPDSLKQLLDMKLSTGADYWTKSKVYMLYTGNTFVIFDHINCTFQNVPIIVAGDSSSSATTIELYSKFSTDPNCSNSASNSIAFLSGDGPANNTVSVCYSWDCVKDTRIVINGKLNLLAKGANNPNSNPSSNYRSNTGGNLSPSILNNSEPSEKLRRQTSSNSIRKLVSDIIVGPDYSSAQNSTAPPSGCITFHEGMKDSIIVSNETHIYLVSVQFLVVLHTFTLEKAGSPFVQVLPTKFRSCLVTLHDNGTVYLRKYIISGMHNISMQLESICASENPRFSSKKSEVLGCIINPIEENSVVVYLSDGRFLRYEIAISGKSSKTAEHHKKLLNTPATPYVRSFTALEEPPTPMLEHLGPSSQQNQSVGCKSPKIGLQHIIRPILESEGENVKIKLKRVTNSYGQLTCLKANNDILVAGTTIGGIVVMKIIDGRLKALKKFSTHSNSPVTGIEFVSKSEILTYSNLSFSANPKCELILTEIWTGASRSLKMDDSYHIQAVRVSALGQYFVIVYKNGSSPCELWDLPRRQLIKTLPSKLPPITCVEWKEPIENIREETFYMTDLGTFLFTFRVEGNRFANATCVKLDTAGNMGGIPVSLFTRASLVFRADSSGTLVIYNTEKKTASPGVNIGRGPLISVHDFEGYFVAQYGDMVELWDFNEVKKVKSLHNGRLKTVALAVMGNFVAYIPKASNGIKFLPLDLSPGILVKSTTISSSSYQYFLGPKAKASKIVSILTNSNPAVQDIIKMTREVSSLEEQKLWSLISNKLSNTKFDDSVDIFSENKAYKEVLVKTAQCVWSCDYGKREAVARILLWAGETDRSAEILLDTEPTDYKTYVLSGLKASVSVGSSNLPESTKAVLKIVATNLIACGETDGGLELLCLLGKHSEACKYVESSNEWNKAILLCKTSLSEQNSEETLCKYAQYLNSKKCVLKSASVFIYIGKFDRAIEVLFGSRMRHLSYLLMYFCEKQNMNLNISEHVRLAIRLDFSRFLFDCGLSIEAIEFCEKLGEAGKDLKQELEILVS